MLKREVDCRREAFFSMSDAIVLAASIKTSLLEIARQAQALGNGLQNAAPGDKNMAGPNNSVAYLLGTAENLSRIAQECGKLDATKILGD